MKTVGIITNEDKDINLEFTEEIAGWLLARGCDILLEPRAAVSLKKTSCSAERDELCAQADFITVLGGDGTFLAIAHSAAKCGTPILGINTGMLGYLTDTGRENAFNALEKALSGDCHIERRMMLRAETRGQGFAGNFIGRALNDVCVLKDATSTTITVEIDINGEYVDTYRADGLIISTPTGSTAYNFSAGGPILKPDTEMAVITPVCPHLAYARPMVVSGEDVIGLRIRRLESAGCFVILDGHNRAAMSGEFGLTVRKADMYTYIIKTNNLSHYDVLRKKIGGREAEARS